ncbi:MAG: formimidoylglutamate deiminase [Bdellovibrionota bacterium]
MKCFELSGLLTRNRYLSPAFVLVDDQGEILQVSNELSEKMIGVEKIKIDAIALPGFPNTHSHAFQYAMAGLAEGTNSKSQKDDFWSWRQIMYKLALSLSPDQMEVIATMAYSQMLAHGYTSVAEFHYIHHDPKGKYYNNRAEMSERLLRAAAKVGINITLVPVYYNTSDFSKAATEDQVRFLHSDPASYITTVESIKNAVRKFPNASYGFGFHSLRAAPIEAMRDILSGLDDLQTPIHMHIAEQIGEVKACQKHTGKRPLEYLMNSLEIGENFNLVHATHMESYEARMVAEKQANIVICPTTEGNLGDGFFPLVEYLKLGGRFSIGSDSHVSVSFLEELRLLEYGQRMLKMERNVNCSTLTSLESGPAIFWPSIDNGYRALGHNKQEAFSVGSSFDSVLIDPEHHAICAVRNEKQLISALVFAANHKIQVGTICRGAYLVNEFKHREEDEFGKDFKRVVREVLND